MAYDNLAQSYDALTYDIPYEKILAFWESVLQKAEKHPQKVLDLACGTGSFSVLLAEKGYRVLGCDLSEQMLTQAAQKAATIENPPYFICQSMQKLSLPEPVDFVVSCLDGVNYLLSPADCRKAFSRVFAALEPGGVFAFDINSKAKLQGLDGQVFLDETEDTYCVWRTEFEDNICYYGVDLFTKDGSKWRRSFEEHRQYAYTPEELKNYLSEAGFRNIRFFADLQEKAPTEESQRIFVYAEKE